jgi:GTPase SAR1 family protein
MYLCVTQIEEGIEKKILVLGLEGAGKSSILAHFTAPSISHNGVPEVSPTEGFNVVTSENEGITLKIYESKF